MVIKIYGEKKYEKHKTKVAVGCVMLDRIENIFNSIQDHKSLNYADLNKINHQNQPCYAFDSKNNDTIEIAKHKISQEFEGACVYGVLIKLKI